MTDTAGYYVDGLSAQRLKKCYEVAPPRVRRYLEAELSHVLDHIRSSHWVLELGCGYGRILDKLAAKARTVVGIDTSPSSLELGKSLLARFPNCHLAVMDAVCLGFADAVFDVVVCIQNGISAFKVDQQALIKKSVRVTRPGGTVLFSSYASEFWSDRLEWFSLQAEHRLIGEIDWQQTRDGVIVCKDGFKATTIGPDGFRALCSSLGLVPRIEVVDGSSIFCEIGVSS